MEIKITEDFHSKLEHLITDPDIVSKCESLFLEKRAADLSCSHWIIDTNDASFSNSDQCKRAMIELDENLAFHSENMRCNQYPRWSYLTLRQVQNTQWAEERLTRGNDLTRLAWARDMTDINIASNLLKKAEECYKEGLDMLPNHTGLLRSYGILCYKSSRLEQAYDLLDRALIDATKDDVEEIHGLLSSIRKKLGLASMAADLFPHTSAKMTLSDRAEKALKDAMVEKGLASRDNKQSVEYPTVGSELDPSDSSTSTDNSSFSRPRKKRSKRKHHERKRKKHRKSHHKKSKRNKKSHSESVNDGTT